MGARTHEDTGRRNKQLVLGEVLKNGSISRTDIAANVGLNAASISRITRDLLDADLIVEREISDSNGRRGRRFVQLAPHGLGGYVVGIGINAFRQSVTLADLENRKIAFWEAKNIVFSDGESFIRLCAEKAAELIKRHVPDQRRFFGVGLAIAGQIDKEEGAVLSAPILGWSERIDVRPILSEFIDGPVVLDTPSAAINIAEATFGVAKGVQNVVTLHCSLSNGIGLLINGRPVGGVRDISSVLSDTPCVDMADASGPHTNFPNLDQCQSGFAFVRRILGEERCNELRNSTDWGRELVRLVERANKGDQNLARELNNLGAGYARAFSMLFTVMPPELLLLAGPLSQSPDFVAGLSEQLALMPNENLPRIDVRATEMTHIGAARWLSIRENLIFNTIDLDLLRTGRTP